MPSSKKIRLIYDFYENDYDGFEQETKIDNDFDYNKILLDSIKDISYDKNRKLTIYSWGILRHDEPKCEISFDLTKFTTKTTKDIKLVDGRDEEIQNSIIRHPLFSELIKKIIEEIETNISREISFFCNHGKHRSVGWTEIVKKYYYPNSIIRHSIY
jgi:RNase adaptor protein for sRNA GlmZ degradation